MSRRDEPDVVTPAGSASAAARDRRPRRLRWALRRALADDTLSQKASLNMVAAVLEYAGRVLVGLLLNPLLVTRLGDVVFGVYQSIARLVGYATPAGGRPSQALKWTIARHQHSAEWEEKRLQVGSAVVVWLLFLPVLAVAGGVLAWFSPLMLGVPQSLHLTVRVAAGLLVVDLVLANLLSIPQSVVQGENLGYKRMGLSVLVVFAGGALTALLVVFGAGIIGVAAGVVATTAMTGLLFLWVARRNVGWFGVRFPAWRAVGAFLRLSGWFLLWNLVMQLMRGSEVVVLGIAASPEQVTVFTLSRYVPEAIFGGVAIVISAIMPGLGGLLGADDASRAAVVRSESMAATWWLATASGVCFLLLQEAFLTLWVGAQYYPGALANLLIIVMTVQFAFIRNDSSIIDLTLDLRAKVLLGLVSAVVSIGIAVFLIRAFDLGITGLAAGFIAGRAILSIAYPVLVCRMLKLPLSGQVKGATRPLAVSAAMFGGAVAVAPAVEAGSWLVLVLFGAASLVAVAAATFFIGLSPEQRTRVSRRARRVAGR